MPAVARSQRTVYRVERKFAERMHSARENIRVAVEEK
jgi:hypothetical protein